MNTESKTSNPITDGVIWKQLLIFFFPIMVGTLFQQLYNTVDAVIVGRFVGSRPWPVSAVLPLYFLTL